MEGQFQRGKREVDACAMTLALRGPDIHLGNTRSASKINQVLTREFDFYVVVFGFIIFCFFVLQKRKNVFAINNTIHTTNTIHTRI